MNQGAFVQNRLGTVQSRHVSAFEEFSDGNFIAPQQRFFHGSHPVGGVMRGVVFELLHARTEPLVGIVMIIRDARTEDIQERKPWMLDTLLDQLREMFLLPAEAARDQRSACGESRGNGIYSPFHATQLHALRFHPDPPRCRPLSGLKTISP